MNIPKQRPTRIYNGITLILDKPSRFDIKHNHLLAGVARDWFQDAAGIHPDACEIRLTSDRSPFLKGTQHVILSGESSIHEWTANRHSLLDHGYSLNIIHEHQTYKAIGVHNIQDCLDFRSETDEDEDSDDDQGNGKDTATTRRGNYPFWTKWSIRKLLLPSPRVPSEDVQFKLSPNLGEVCRILRRTKDTLLYLDIEVSRVYGTLDCVGFRFDDGPVYVVPCYRYTGQLAYSNAHHLLAALSVAMQRNTVVGHNIAGFDLPYLSTFYRVGFGRSIYDTMLANHRLFAEVEKSLGHVIGMWTDLPYHKDQIITPRNAADEQRYWRYNAQDVACLSSIRKAQLDYAKEIGALGSIAKVNRCVYPYTLMTLRGIKVDEAKLRESTTNLADRVLQLNRVARWLMGKPFNMGSNKQCVDYFHGTCGYPPVAKSEKTGNPSLGKKAMYQLAVKHDHPMIAFALGYRAFNKDLSSLSFNELTLRR